MKTEFSPEWQQWIESNISNGQNKDYIFNLLIDEGYSYDSIKKEMQFEPTPKYEFTSEWLEWIKTNIAAGQDKNGLFKVLLTHGYAYDAITQEMQFEPTVPLDELVNPFRSEPQIHSLSNRSIAGKSLPKDDLFIPNSGKLGSDNFSIYKVEDFLNEEECDHVVSVIRSQLRPSELSSFESDATFRTSKTCLLYTSPSPRD